MTRTSFLIFVFTVATFRVEAAPAAPQSLTKNEENLNIEEETAAAIQLTKEILNKAEENAKLLDKTEKQWIQSILNFESEGILEFPEERRFKRSATNINVTRRADGDEANEYYNADSEEVVDDRSPDYDDENENVNDERDSMPPHDIGVTVNKVYFKNNRSDEILVCINSQNVTAPVDRMEVIQARWYITASGIVAGVCCVCILYFYCRCQIERFTRRRSRRDLNDTISRRRSRRRNNNGDNINIPAIWNQPLNNFPWNPMEPMSMPSAPPPYLSVHPQLPPALPVWQPAAPSNKSHLK